ncbi:MAG: hypothetical protein IIY36_05670, partial [Lachnospiraceae bacterium]|nr:hypothetical protein [Lachnospiraceae bacterium]
VAAPSSCPELKEAANKWLAAAGTDAQEEAAKNLIAELEEDVCTTEDLLNLVTSDRGRQIFGEEKAGQIAEEARQMIAAGQMICPCPGCQAGHAVLEVKEGLFE